MMGWLARWVRDASRGYRDVDIASMKLKLHKGRRKFTDREHSAYVCTVQQAAPRWRRR